MKTKTIRSTFFAVVAVFLTAAITVPFAALAQSVTLTVEQRLQKALDKRAEWETELRALEQAPGNEGKEKGKSISFVSREQQIESMRERIEKLDRTIGKLKEDAAREAQGAHTSGLTPASASAKNAASASEHERKTAKPKEMSLVRRQAIAADLNRQGFRLLQTLSEGKETENKFISPYSIDSAFGMVYTGAKGRTQEEIRSVLGMPADPADADTFFLLMSAQYQNAFDVDVLVSNSVWVDRRVTDLIRPDYCRTIETYYGGAFYVEDFRQKATVADKVNALVDRNTKGMIRDIISPDDLTEQSRMILLNTLFFEAKWLYPFPVGATRPTPFHLFGGGTKQVQMMYQKRHFDYYSCEEDNVHAVVLPYENDRFGLVALMPLKPGGDQGQAAMKSILAKIGDKLDTWLTDPSPYETRVYLPKVDLADTTRLKDPLKALGMPSPFSFATADFSGMFDYAKNPGDERFFIEKVIHKTALKMDEFSTKAAAATAIIGAFGGGIPRQPPPENIFRADRPFLVLIRDNRTGLILFMGRINDPGK
jgi:serpin B